MPEGARYALLTSAGAHAKPFVYPDLAALARAVHRRRHGQALQLRNDRVLVRDRPAPVRVVAVYGEDQVGGRARFIGYAWMGEVADWTKLRDALDAAEPNLVAA